MIPLIRTALCLPLLAALPALAQPCGEPLPQRQAFFGDTHVHTSYSQDANWRMGNSRSTPDDAYRFARGEHLALPPFDEAGHSVRHAQLERPLDFAVVTDHAEDIGMVRICDNPDYDGPGAWLCGRNQLFVKAVSAVLLSTPRRWPA